MASAAPVPRRLPPAESMKGKGTPLKATFAWIDQRHGPSARPAVLAAVDEDVRRTLSGVVLPTTWYPLRVMVQLLTACDTVLGSGDRAVCHEIGRFASEYEVNLLHKVFLKIASLDYWLKSAAAMWPFYWGAGKLSAHAGASDGYIELAEFNPISTAFCIRFEGWVERTVELSRKSDVRVRHVRCVLDGAPACRWEGTWRR